MFVSLALSVVGWVLFALPLYTSALALHDTIPLAVALFVVPASGLATVIPLPGGLGGVEILLTGLVASMTGIDASAAEMIALLYRLCAYWFVIVLGGICSAYLPTSAEELSRAGESSK